MTAQKLIGYAAYSIFLKLQDPRKYNRVKELLFLQKEIVQAKKVQHVASPDYEVISHVNMCTSASLYCRALMTSHLKTMNSTDT